jgi:dihydroorotase
MEEQDVAELADRATLERRYDTLLKGGLVIDPASGRNGVFDVAIEGGRVAAIDTAIPESSARQTINVSGKLLTAGLIDTHAHIYQHVTGRFGLNPDAVGVRSGVATLIDQGGPSCLTIDGFRKFIVEPSQTRVRCFLSTYLAGGLHGHIHTELYGPEQINVGATVEAINNNRDIVCGLKSHAEPGHYARWGLAVLKKSKEIARAAQVSTYVHLGTLWPVRDGEIVDPQALLAEILPLMDAGDIVAHPFTRHPSGFTDSKGKVHPLVFEALDKGVNIDVGRGNHFSIKVARAVLDAGVLPHTLGADLHGYSITPASTEQGAHVLAAANAGRYQDGAPPAVGATKASDDPAFSLYYAMSEMLALGVPLQHVIAMVTANAAKMMGAAEKLGSLAVGREAEIAVMHLQAGDFVMRDSLGETLNASQRIRPIFALYRGEVCYPSSEYLPFWERAGQHLGSESISQ